MNAIQNLQFGEFLMLGISALAFIQANQVEYKDVKDVKQRKMLVYALVASGVSAAMAILSAFGDTSNFGREKASASFSNFNSIYQFLIYGCAIFAGYVYLNNDHKSAGYCNIAAGLTYLVFNVFSTKTDQNNGLN